VKAQYDPDDPEVVGGSYMYTNPRKYRDEALHDWRQKQADKGNPDPSDEETKTAEDAIDDHSCVLSQIMAHQHMFGGGCYGDGRCCYEVCRSILQDELKNELDEDGNPTGKKIPTGKKVPPHWLHRSQTRTLQTGRRPVQPPPETASGDGCDLRLR